MTNVSKSNDKLQTRGEEKEIIHSIYQSNSLLAPVKPIYHTNKDYIMNGVTELALKDMELQRKSSPLVSSTTTTNSTNKSTLIIHSVQKDNSDNKNHDLVYKLNTLHQDQQQNDSPDSQTPADDDQGRARKRRRDFFGTIRKRLNKSKGRSKSVDKNTYNGAASKNEMTSVSACNSPSSRSVSMDRARDHSSNSGHSTNNIYALPVGPLPREGSARSSLSEISGVSGTSSRTYLNDASTLILETTENGTKKYYLVPLSLAQKNKWRKKGTKLHIFNDHTFVAKHLPGGTNCEICNRTLPRRLGKQGYECRDCSLKCHKQCHHRTESICPNSTVQKLELSGNIKSTKLDAKLMS